MLNHDQDVLPHQHGIHQFLIQATILPFYINLDAFSHFPNLELRDQTQRLVDLWQCVGNDSLEGVYFGMLKAAMETQDEQSRRIALLAARISRKILDGGEVVLP